MKKSNMTQFGFDVELLGDKREISWTRKSRAMVIHDLSFAEAHQLLELLENVEGLKKAAQQLGEMLSDAPVKEAPPTQSATVRPSPHPAAVAPVTRVRVTKPVTPVVIPHDSTPVVAPNVAPKPPNPADIMVKAKIAASTPPVITPADKAKATQLAEAAQVAAEKVPAKPIGLDPKAALEAYRNTPNRAKGGMTRTQARGQVAWKAGDKYKDKKIIQSGVEDTAYGDAWVLTLESGDSVMVAMDGRELEYVPVASAEPPPPVVQCPNTPAEPKTEAATPTDLPEPPDDVLENRKMVKLVQWLASNTPSHKGGVNVDAMVEQMEGLRPRAKCLARAKDRSTVERRVRATLTVCDLAEA